MSYAVKEIYYTLQCEGANVGRAAVFCRFTGCNLWTGREVDRPSAQCRFCDTDFVGTDGSGGGWYATAQALASAVGAEWRGKRTFGDQKFVVCTGGEPLLQLNDEAVRALHEAGFAVAVETNGTLKPPAGLDWICVSPKSRAPFVLHEGNELKLVFPQLGIDPRQFEHLPFQHFFLQPMDGPDLAKNIDFSVRYCLEHPRWRLSLQVHKMIGLKETRAQTNSHHRPLVVR